MTEHWKVMIASGNQAFKKERWTSALAMYKEALVEAKTRHQENLFVDADRAFASVLICFFNIADTYHKMSNYELAVEQFYFSFKFLGEQLNLKKENENVKHAVLSGYTQAKTEWLLFKGRPELQSNVIDTSVIRRIDKIVELSQQIH